MIADVLRWTGGVGIAAIAAGRCVITFAPQVVFDVDPAFVPTPLAGLGPAGSLVLDALLLAACGCGLLGEVLAGRRVDWRLLALALVPVPVVAWHGANDLGDLWRGSTWVAAAAAAAVVAHLGRDRSLRLVLIALLVAILAPVALRGASQASLSVLGWSFVGSEHAQTIAEFEASGEAYFADRGWAPDSAAARIYERRLRQPEPRGWFPTSNIFAAMMAFGLLMSAGLGLASLGRHRRWLVPVALGAAVTIAGLFLSGSKGAAAAALVAVAFLLIPLLPRPAGLERRLALLGGGLAVALAVAALVAVVVRGALLPEGFAGEKSLLFRWHYLVGAVRVIEAHPALGVGPDGFQAAYTQFRLSRSPEEVISAHGVFWDWPATLGVVGVAWVALVGLLLFRAGARLDQFASRRSGRLNRPRSAGSECAAGGRYRALEIVLAAVGEPQDPPATPPARAALLSAAAVALLGLMPALVIEAASLEPPAGQLQRGAGVLLFVLVAAGLGAFLGRLKSRLVDWAVAASAVGLVVHAQIEMTFFDPGSVVWMMCVLGLAGGACDAGDGPRRRVGGLVSCLLLWALAVSLAAFRVPGALGAQSSMVAAAAFLHPPAESRDGRIGQREQAARLLVGAYERMPQDGRPLEAAARQLLMAATLAPEPRRAELLDRAVDLAERAVQEHERPSAMALAADARRWRALTTGSADDWRRAIDHALRLTEIDPAGIGPWRRLGDLLWASGRQDEAAEAYRRALEADRNFELDPLKQMSERDRERVLGRVMSDE